MTFLVRLSVIVGVLTSVLVAGAAEPITLYVAPHGNDGWSGRLPAANAEKTDGPLATALGARDALRRLRAGGSAGPATVLLRGGTYRMAGPLLFEPQDSGSAAAPVVWAAYPGELPVLSGGQVIRGWKPEPGGLWSALVPEVAAGKWHFQQLFVDGKRRTRARSPNEGYYFVVAKAPPVKDSATGKQVVREATAFVFAPGEIKPWPDLAEANVVVYHSWETSRLRIAQIDQANRIVTFTGRAAWPFENWGPKQRYYVENVREALDAPGEWYLDRAAGTLYYYPMPGEDMSRTEVVAPLLIRLVELRGKPDAGQLVQHVTLRGLVFSHGDWTLEPQGHSDAQAAVSVPAAILADGARHCAIEGCEVSHVGDYAIWLRRGCKDNRIQRNRIFDVGAGGVRIGEAVMPPNDQAESSGNLVDNNHVFDGGHVYPAGVGVWVAQSSRNVISHNEIHDLCYSGMSIGWNWDDAPNRCHHNTIEFNHVHHVMRGVLSDGGAIYTLGASPGSIIRNNVFHDVISYPSPPYGWGIYLDATCSGYLVENNVVYNIHSGCLMYSNGGHEHTIRNNVFANPAHYGLWPFWEKRPNTFRKNIVYLTQGSLFWPHSERSLRERLAAKEALGEWDENVYWHAGGPQEIRFFRRALAEWQALGLDRRSVIADPKFMNASEADFRLQPDSLAIKLGFQPIDTSRVGLYGDAAWVGEARRVKHPKTVLPAALSPPGPKEVNDDFEKTPAGSAPEGAVVSGEQSGASIRVSAEQAAGGKQSLKFTDAKGLQPSWQPHAFYEPHLREGVVRQSFDLWLGRDAELLTEWRDESAYPRCIGPRVSFDASGKVSAAGKALTTVPLRTWVHIEVQATIGKSGPRRFTLTVAEPSQPKEVFADLPFAGDDFRELHWLGFISTAAADTAFFLDNLGIERLDKPTEK